MKKNRVIVRSSFIAVVVFAAILRTSGGDFDRYHAVLFDEQMVGYLAAALSAPQSISQYFSPFFSPLNPYAADFETNYTAYGSFHSLILKILAPTGPTTDPQMYIMIARVFSAGCSLLSIFVIFLLGSLLGGKQNGAISAFLWTFSAVSLQEAHMALPTAAFTLFALLSLYAACAFLKGEGAKAYALCGWCLAIALSFDPRGLLLLAPVTLAIVLRLWVVIVSGKKMPEGPTFLFHELGRNLLATGLLLVVFALSFRCLEPYAFQGEHLAMLSPIFVEHWQSRFEQPFGMLYESSIRASRPDNLHSIAEYIFYWGATPLISLLAIIGLCLGLRLCFRSTVLLFAWPITVIAYVLNMHVFEPVVIATCIPIFFLFAGYSLNELIDFCWRQTITAEVDSPKELRASRAYVASIILTTLVLFSTAFWGVSMATVYKKEPTRYQASRWIADNIPIDSVILTEQGDTRLPGLVGERVPGPYRFTEFPVLEPDSLEKAEGLVGSARAAEYLILASNRGAWVALGNNRHFAHTGDFYQKLLRGELGFRLVAAFHQYPQLLGVDIHTDLAHPGFTFRERPSIWVFQKTKSLTLQELTHLLPYPPGFMHYAYKDFLLDLQAAERRMLQEERTGDGPIDRSQDVSSSRAVPLRDPIS